jgi:hypothetical protein
VEVVHGKSGGMRRRERVFVVAGGVGGSGKRYVQVANS